MAMMTPTTMITPALAAANRFAPKAATAPNAVKDPATNAAATNGATTSAATNGPTNAAGATGAPNAASTNATGAASASEEAADRFLTLLVTQLRNQDPLNPLDNAQVTTQLAQLSTVSGINKLNETVAALSASFAAGQYLQAVGLVGRD